MGASQTCSYKDSCFSNSQEQRKQEIDLRMSPNHTRVNSVATPDPPLQSIALLKAVDPLSTNMVTSTQTKVVTLRSNSPPSPKNQWHLDRVSSRSRTLGEGNAVNQPSEVLVTPHPQTPGNLAEETPAKKAGSAKQQTIRSPDFFGYFGADSTHPHEEMNAFPMSVEFSNGVAPRKLEVLHQAGGFNFQLKDFVGNDNDIYFVESRDDHMVYYGQGRSKMGSTCNVQELDLFSQILREGQGYFWVRDSILFVGYFSNDMPNGPGILIYKDDSYFLGIWTDGKLNGYGVFHSVDAKVYRGYWKENLQEGEGEEIWLATGTTYTGGFVAGKRHGQGTLFLAEEGAVYKGNFHQNKFCGHGTYKWASGDIYTGQWLDDKMHGKGVFSWVDGRVYRGEYVNGFKEGYGVFTWRDGRRYEGLWKKGHPYGQGTFTDSSGTKSSGVFGDGLLSLRNLSGRPPKIPKIS